MPEIFGTLVEYTEPEKSNKYTDTVKWLAEQEDGKALALPVALSDADRDKKLSIAVVADRERNIFQKAANLIGKTAKEVERTLDEKKGEATLTFRLVERYKTGPRTKKDQAPAADSAETAAE